MVVQNFLKETLIFLKKQASSALFGGLMLFFLLISQYIHIPGIYRYDLLFIGALVIQAVLIWTRMERPREILAIVIFHIFAIGMEIYKTSAAIGSWSYPEPSVLAIATVPLFTGFMYSSVGSYIARAWRINNFLFKNLPHKAVLISVAVLIYVNFFTNHFTYDVRWIIFGLLIIIFWKTKFYVTLTHKTYRMHPLISNGLLALFVWLAEQVGTFARVWIYPNQALQWTPVSFQMFTSWYMLLIFSFIIISLLQPKEAHGQ
ncbi:MAG: hypothetical protein A2830_00350 [Candidatus Taylorbacteria bacterium RIFCSPHIGHO2_01_FULL_44_110]|uniref:Uncharacterized protein n=1 Tax=Candidatus Taylorbacteria bacterium RIFCSPHIGHO2_12_FULL_45_16 TaxID=1802315 RepID=A0A1G2MYJ8_9BACT|nr:MAG: hypothetical protein A2830_00350 [Candidatus Taylorbacteria bacterium RIFCSPHIGHO2_01_FULL_44_110]OHA28853.1 MAG: hypothetical protein A3F51_02575 [Candidatus Taylorbacteria bacterium RIFCSPHIGHO2_12_FULL_45_16]OHA32908.1 MAG: hypothetical protein A3A23_03375 [Candidatus Taylorbacteria bacterium RIFCSPLOWO2_01_FULL_45_59]OHA39782.1 MAG: hypothetical protein A3I98_03385 [Candidatus Taylorbacteria bacterium RIFCSPLOWO2_02_FULL_45_10b]OHA45208.1 MAG: hypothetical protein A3G04_02305 [Candi